MLLLLTMSKKPASDAPAKNGQAIAGFIVSLCSYLINDVPSLAIILGVVGTALSIAGLQKAQVRGASRRGLSIAGMVLGSIGVLLACSRLIGLL